MEFAGQRGRWIVGGDMDEGAFWGGKGSGGSKWGEVRGGWFEGGIHVRWNESTCGGGCGGVV